MTRKLLILLSLWMFASSIHAQDTLSYKSKLQMRFLFGKNIPNAKLLQGQETDYLLQYEDNTHYWQVVSITCFASKHLGFEFSLQGSTANRVHLTKRESDFKEKMQSLYQADYYVDTKLPGSFGQGGGDLLGGDITRFYAGAIYRFENEKFYVYPKFSIGILSFPVDSADVHLKQKNSNLEYNVHYSAGKETMRHFIVAPSVSLGYKISKYTYFNVDVAFSYYRANFVIEKKITNLYTKETTLEKFAYKKGMSTLSLGAGLIFVLWQYNFN